MTDQQRPYFTDAEVDEMCAGLKMPAAKIRFLRSIGLKVDRKPNGAPLAWKPVQAVPAVARPEDNGFDLAGLNAWAAARDARRAAKKAARKPSEKT